MECQSPFSTPLQADYGCYAIECIAYPNAPTQTQKSARYECSIEELSQQYVRDDPLCWEHKGFPIGKCTDSFLDRKTGNYFMRAMIDQKSQFGSFGKGYLDAGLGRIGVSLGHNYYIRDQPSSRGNYNDFVIIKELSITDDPARKGAIITNIVRNPPGSHSVKISPEHVAEMRKILARMQKSSQYKNSGKKSSYIQASSSFFPKMDASSSIPVPNSSAPPPPSETLPTSSIPPPSVVKNENSSTEPVDALQAARDLVSTYSNDDPKKKILMNSYEFLLSEQEKMMNDNNALQQQLTQQTPKSDINNMSPEQVSALLNLIGQSSFMMKDTATDPEEQSQAEEEINMYKDITKKNPGLMQMIAPSMIRCNSRYMKKNMMLQSRLEKSELEKVHFQRLAAQSKHQTDEPDVFKKLSTNFQSRFQTNVTTPPVVQNVGNAPMVQQSHVAMNMKNFADLFEKTQQEKPVAPISNSLKNNNNLHPHPYGKNEGAKSNVHGLKLSNSLPARSVASYGGTPLTTHLFQSS